MSASQIADIPAFRSRDPVPGPAGGAAAARAGPPGRSLSGTDPSGGDASAGYPSAGSDPCRPYLAGSGRTAGWRSPRRQREMTSLWISAVPSQI